MKPRKPGPCLQEGRISYGIRLPLEQFQQAKAMAAAENTSLCNLLSRTLERAINAKAAGTESPTGTMQRL